MSTYGIRVTPKVKPIPSVRKHQMPRSLPAQLCWEMLWNGALMAMTRNTTHRRGKSEPARCCRGRAARHSGRCWNNSLAAAGLHAVPQARSTETNVLAFALPEVWSELADCEVLGRADAMHFRD